MHCYQSLHHKTDTDLRTHEELREQVRKQMSLKSSKKLGFPLFADQESPVCYPNTASIILSIGRALHKG